MLNSTLSLIRRLRAPSVLIALLATAGMALSTSTSNLQPGTRSTLQTAAVQGLILQLKQPPADPARSAEAVNNLLTELKLDLRYSRQVGANWVLVEAKRSLSPALAAQLAEQLRSDARVAFVISNSREQRAAVPTDTLFRDLNTATAQRSPQWWLDDYNAVGNSAAANFTKAWDISKGSGSPVVAVLDSGITSHPDLATNLLPGYNFVSKAEYAGNGVGRSASSDDLGDALTQAEFDANLGLWDGCLVAPVSSWHGTLVAGQLGAVTNNAAGVAGINWNARILPVRVSGRCGAAVADMVDGMRWAGGLSVTGVPANANPAKVLVIGFAGVTSCDLNDANKDVAGAAKLYLDTIAELRAKNVLIVASAGNLRGAVGRPANCAGVLGVAAVNQLGFKTIYSNFGSQVQLAAPGGDAANNATCDALLADKGIVSTNNTGTKSPATYGYAAVSGSSFAAPQVAGTAALMWAINPALTLAQVEAGLRSSARPHVQATALGYCSATNKSRCTCTTSTCGSGLLDAEEALKFAQAPTSYAAPVRSALSLSSAALSSCGTLQGSTPIAAPVVAPAPVPVPVPTPTPTPTPTPDTTATAGGGGGGGAMAPFWVLGLVMAAAALRSGRRDQGRARH
jgi:serine protease